MTIDPRRVIYFWSIHLSLAAIPLRRASILHKICQLFSSTKAIHVSGVTVFQVAVCDKISQIMPMISCAQAASKRLRSQTKLYVTIT